MTAIAYPARRSGGKVIVLIIIVCCLSLALAAVASEVTERSHAVAKHGATIATFARQCSDQNRVNSTWQSTRRGTFAETCLMRGDAWDMDADWTVRIISKTDGTEITVFGHTGDVASLEEYMIRQLYIFLQ
jgi:hypothetical protein